jgi:hypothetical protein
MQSETDDSKVDHEIGHPELLKLHQAKGRLRFSAGATTC